MWYETQRQDALNAAETGLYWDIESTAEDMFEQGCTETDYTPMQERVERWDNRRSYIQCLNYAIECAIEGKECPIWFLL